MNHRDMKLNELERAYFADVRSILEDAIEAANVTNADEAFESNTFIEEIDASVDGCSWIIYTYQARLVAVLTDNVAAIEDVTGSHVGTPEQIAFYAMVQDVYDLARNEYFWSERNEKAKAS